LNEHFDRVALINLDRRTDRLNQFSAQAKRLGIDFVRYSAVDAEALGVGAVGACAQSHRKVLQDAIDDGVERLFVFEDDAGFHIDFQAKFEHTMKIVPDDWQMLYLGSWPYAIEEVGIEGIKRTLGCYSTHAYGAKREIFADLIGASLDHMYPIDAAYGNLHKQIRAYIASPSFVTQVPGYSDIRRMDVDDRAAII